MGCSANQLRDELRNLRKGRGVYALDVADKIGPALRTHCEIGPADETHTARAKVVDWLVRQARGLPDDLELAVLAGMAVHPQAQQLFLSQRIQWLAERLDRDQRTARRRLDEGVHRLAEAAATGIPAAPAAAPTPGDGWYVAELRAVVRLDRPVPEALEFRRIVAERDGVDRLEAMLTLPREHPDPAAPHELAVEVIYGATVGVLERASPSTFRFVLELPGALRAGDSHEYALLFRIPPDQPMSSQYLIVPARRCDLFDLRIRFDRNRPPSALWRVADQLYVGREERLPDSPVLGPDKCGEIHEAFHGLRPGFSYGVSWRNEPDR